MLRQYHFFRIGLSTTFLVGAVLFLANDYRGSHPPSLSRSMERIQHRSLQEKYLEKNQRLSYDSYDSSEAKTKQTHHVPDFDQSSSLMMRAKSEESVASLQEDIYDDPFNAMRRLRKSYKKYYKSSKKYKSTKAPSKGKGGLVFHIKESGKGKGGQTSRAPSSGTISASGKKSKKKGLVGKGKGKGKGKGRAEIIIV